MRPFLSSVFTLNLAKKNLSNSVLELLNEQLSIILRQRLPR